MKQSMDLNNGTCIVVYRVRLNRTAKIKTAHSYYYNEREMTTETGIEFTSVERAMRSN